MSTDAPQSSFEKAASAVLFILTAAAGWIPFLYATWREPYAVPSFLLISSGLGIFSAAMIYDTAERLIGQGKGIYAAAVFFSFAPVGATIADSALLPISALLFIAAAVNWIAARAEVRNRNFNLFVIGGMILICGFLFSFQALCIVFVFGIRLASRNVEKKTIPVLALTAAFMVGSGLRTVLNPDIPLILELPIPESLNAVTTILLQLPWLVWIIPLAIFSFQKGKLPDWQRGGLIALLATYAVGYEIGINPLAIGAIAAPMLSLCVTDMLLRWFVLKRSESKIIHSLPLLISAAAMLLLVAARFIEVDWFEKLDRYQAFAALFLFVLAIIFLFRKLPRWSFAVSVALGFLAGSLWWVRPGLLDMEDPMMQEPPSDPVFLNYIPVLIVAFVVIMRRLYGRRIPRAALKQGERFQFSGANLRLFDRTRRPEWIGEPIDISALKKQDFSFAIFGDVTGAEFPVTTRQGGYFIFRDLVEAIEKQKAEFVISVGDLSTQAGQFAYRRLRQILRHIPVPFAVSPGNHDLFADDEYLPKYFQSLFGPDNSVFTLGSIKYVLLNNAWGSVDETQFTWLEKALPRKEESFTFVFCHKPPIDPRQDEFYGMEDRGHAARLHELFKQHKVTAVFSGHIHALLKHEQDGVTYIISGGGGSKLDDKQAVYHYLLADVTENNVRVRALPIRKKDAEKTEAPLMEITFSKQQ